MYGQRSLCFTHLRVGREPGWGGALPKLSSRAGAMEALGVSRLLCRRSMCVQGRSRRIVHVTTSGEAHRTSEVHGAWPTRKRVPFPWI